MQRVAVTDYTFPSLEVEAEILEPLGLKLDAAQCRSPQELIHFLKGSDFILTQFAPLNSDVISSLSDAKVIVRYGIGVDNVDVNAADEMGIPVCNVPDYCIDEVAEHALALILASTRQVVANARHVQDRNWGLAVPLQAMRCLKSMSVGIIGLGRIGREVANRLRPFKCRILAYDPALPNSAIQELGLVAVDINTLLGACDLITLHCPANAATKHLIDGETIDRMKPGVMVVNVARGAIVNTDSLVAGLQCGRISFAALDVLETEPCPSDHPLLSMENVLIHSHIASASEAAVERLRHEAASIVALAAEGRPLRNVVNGVSNCQMTATPS